MPLEFDLFSLVVGGLIGALMAGIITWLCLRAGTMLLRQQLTQEQNQQETLQQIFDRLATQALQQNHDSFMRTAGEQFDKTRQAHDHALLGSVQNMAAMLQPLRQQVTGLSEQVQALEVKREGAYQQLLQQLAQQAQLQDRLREETSELRRIMKHPAERGAWGDIQLQHIFRLSGMESHIGDFVAQPTITAEDKKLRPDFIVNLPGDKHIAIDAKSPMDHFYKSETSDEPAIIEAALRDHAGSIRGHIRELGRRDYGRHINGSPEFTVMYLPGEHLLTSALRADRDLMQFALENRVVLATPTTLFALLRTLAFGWQQANVTENAQRIAALGHELYDSLSKFVDHWNSLGNQLNKAVQSFNQTIGSLQSRVLPKARRLKELEASIAGDLTPLPSLTEEARLVVIADPKDERAA
jgi:DNA recombination protein RmuC